ncbi:probable AMP deaminase isoform X1 [Rhododendron vialii]|uniref:probable AMP deaminase isoform X1 n=1 Tax=Rhododendron vialii TaxID=182163 RepID=UPI00265D6E24|nr:probable AMP deaminase isoform X1 [Rhododendron vialii]
MDSSSSSSSPSSSSLNLALAALFGASVMAISAFFIHKRSVDQVLDRLLKLRTATQRHPPSFSSSAAAEDPSLASEDDEEIEIAVDEEEIEEVATDDDVLSRYRVSSSMPNVALSNHWFDDRPTEFGNRAAASASWDKLNLIPSGLPPLHTARKDGQDHYVNKSGSKIRVGSGGRLMTPRSSRGYAFDSTGDSDDEGTEVSTGQDILFTYENLNSSADIINLHANNSDIHNVSAPPFEVDNSSCIPDQNCRATANEAEENVVLHDARKADTALMHAVGNDPIVTNNIIPQTTTMNESTDKEEEEVWKMIRGCLDLRERYVYRENVAPWMKAPVEGSSASGVNSDPLCFVPVEATAHHFRMEDGVVRVYASENDATDLFPVASSTMFFTDMHHLLKVMSIGNVRSACHHRLRFLEEKFRLHLLVNADTEFLAQKSAPHRDFYNIRKVDTHVHHSACMNQKQLLRFIKSKLRNEPDEVVIFRDGMYFTLKEVFESLQLTGYDLNVDLMDVHADKSTFHRFDKFNLKYNPCGQSRLREIFLKQDNLIQGRFIAEVTKQVLSDLEASKYQMAEYRVSIYGRKQSEWDQLASWFINNELYSENVVWLIQLPRLYNVYKSMGTATSFQNILDNVFIPLFEVTVDPNSHPHLHMFLMQVVGFDLVDDESKPERRPTKHMPKPAEWTNEFNPAYSYYAYYCYANLYTLNKLRESKGMPAIRLRPHCGEAGDVDHLAAAFLLCHNISHGIILRKSPVLQYLYYLAQIGLAMSPLSNNSLFLDYHRNPFPMFFQRGLNVSLSTDDPLQIHLTKEPLVEEYSVAAKVWKLTSCDLCEIARNSVYQSGFSHASKLHWLGSKYFKSGPEGNDIHQSNVPDLRISFRYATWKEEMQYVYSGMARLPKEIDF